MADLHRVYFTPTPGTHKTMDENCIPLRSFLALLHTVPPLSVMQTKNRWTENHTK